MENTEENAVELHGDEEIIEVIDLNETEQGPGGWKTVKLLLNQHLPVTTPVSGYITAVGNWN